MPPRPRLSVVCPAYQEEDVLPRFHAVLVPAVAGLEAEFELELLYVDDGSRDRTLHVLRGLAAADPRVRYVSLSRNFGHQAALTAGLDHATGDAVVSLDSDLQHPPALIPVLVGKWREGYDVVLTVRGDDRRLGWFKRASSRAFYRLLGWVSTVEVRPAAADFRLLSRRAADELGRLREPHRYVRGMVQWLGFPAAEVPFEPAARQGGVSKYTLRRMLRFAADGLFSFSPAPPRLAAAGGLAVTAAGWVSGVAAVLLLVPLTDPVARVGLVLLTALHATAACGLVAAGVLGEYLARIYEQAKDRPLYLVKEASPAPVAGAARQARAA
jgi:polyisoprenyl-phosphate glycosyltransferase